MEKSIFETKEQYLAFIKQWKETCAKGVILDLQHYVLYALFRGKDINKCLSPTSRDETLANVKYWVEESNPKYLELWPFGETITVAMIEKARAIRKEVTNQ